MEVYENKDNVLPIWHSNDRVEVFPGVIGHIMSSVYYAMPNGQYFLEVELEDWHGRPEGFTIFVPFFLCTRIVENYDGRSKNG